MTDRELLELAAKAVGLTDMGAHYVDRVFVNLLVLEKQQAATGPAVFSWNPLADDGGAFRLEVALSFVAVEWHGRVEVDDRIEVGEFVIYAGKFRAVANRTACAKLEHHAGDRRAARRRAGVLAAAEIGRSMG